MKAIAFSLADLDEFNQLSSDEAKTNAIRSALAQECREQHLYALQRHLNLQ